jgi:hypothetical protein
MKIIRDVLAELFSMFWADARMTAAILVVVVIAGALVNFTAINRPMIGVLLLLGCLAIVIEAAVRETRKRMAR